MQRIRESWREMSALLREDIELHAAWPRTFGLIRGVRPTWFTFLYLLFAMHMFPAAVLYRLQVFLYESGCPRAATAVSRLNAFLFDVAIGNHVRAGGGLLIAHGHVVLDGWTKLGRRVEINPFVTLGIGNSSRRPFELWGPEIGDDVNIGTGAKVIGRVKVGEKVKIGANAVVVSDIPPFHTAVGVPARAIPGGRRRETETWEPPRG
jgi:serine O-acetyltransferase